MNVHISSIQNYIKIMYIDFIYKQKLCRIHKCSFHIIIYMISYIQGNCLHLSLIFRFLDKNISHPHYNIAQDRSDSELATECHPGTPDLLKGDSTEASRQLWLPLWPEVLPSPRNSFPCTSIWKSHLGHNGKPTGRTFFSHHGTL